MIHAVGKNNVYYNIVFLSISALGIALQYVHIIVLCVTFNKGLYKYKVPVRHRGIQCHIKLDPKYENRPKNALVCVCVGVCFGVCTGEW